VYRTSSVRREIGMRTGPYTGGAVLLPWDAIDLGVRRKLLRARTIAVENRRSDTRALLGLAAACGFALLVVSGSGFGQLSHSWLAQGGWFIVSYGLLLAGVIVPSKVYNVLASGRPCIAAVEQDCEVADIIGRHDCGFVVAPGEATALRARILELAADRERCAAMGMRARCAALEFDRPRQVAAYDTLLREVAAQC